jgi:hypothetical protein
MPSIVNVKVSNVGTIVRGDKNMVEINGYDLTNNKGFKKAFFETKRDGGRTKNAEISDGLTPGDFIEVTMDDTSWKNVQFIKKIAEPAGGASAPDMGKAPSSGGGGGGGSDRMSKAEWAAKDKAKELSMARHKAVQTAAAFCAIHDKTATAAAVTAMEKLAYRIEAYLLKGDFDADLDAPEPEVSTVAETPASTEGNQAEGSATSPPAADDDIPF